MSTKDYTDIIAYIASEHGVELLRGLGATISGAVTGVLALPVRVQHFEIRVEDAAEPEKLVDEVIRAADTLLERVRRHLDAVRPLPPVDPMVLLVDMLRSGDKDAPLDQHGALIVRLLAAVQRKDWKDVESAALALQAMERPPAPSETKEPMCTCMLRWYPNRCKVHPERNQ